MSRADLTRLWVVAAVQCGPQCYAGQMVRAVLTRVWPAQLKSAVGQEYWSQRSAVCRQFCAAISSSRSWIDPIDCMHLCNTTYIVTVVLWPTSLNVSIFTLPNTLKHIMKNLHKYLQFLFAVVLLWLVQSIDTLQNTVNFVLGINLNIHNDGFSLFPMQNSSWSRVQNAHLWCTFAHSNSNLSDENNIQRYMSLNGNSELSCTL